jgi:hypothetical protein
VEGYADGSLYGGSAGEKLSRWARHMHASAPPPTTINPG